MDTNKIINKIEKEKEIIMNSPINDYSEGQIKGINICLRIIKERKEMKK